MGPVQILRTLRERKLFLLVSLVLQFLLLPYLVRSAGGLFVPLLFTAVVAAGVYATGRSRSVLVTSFVLAGLALLLSWVDPFFRLQVVDVVRTALVGAFYTFLTVVVLYEVLRSRRVTADTLYGAASAYLLMGFSWATLYSLIEAIQPGSFSVAATAGQYAEIGGFDLLYYSFVTLTTLGYGEITPVSHLARSLAILQAATGVLYLAFLVARLVTLYERDPSLGGPPAAE